MKIKKILSLVRQAIQKYNMIDDGDVIGVGVSGGKDSLVLLYALNSLKLFYPKEFTLKAISIDMGFEHSDFSEIKKLCNKMNIEYHIEETRIKQIVFDELNEKNPCSLCANLRRGALCKAALRLKCNKIALGHNRDDANETLLMNLFYNSRIHCFEPVTVYEDIDLTLIRPILYLSEKQTSTCAGKFNLPVMKKLCPNDGYSKREEIKKLIEFEFQNQPNIKKNIFSAISKSEQYIKHEKG